MAKQPTSKGGTARIRFIMLDAEIPEGDLSQITLAIQNALKPTATIIQQRLPATPANVILPTVAQEAELDIDGEAGELQDQAQPEIVSSQPFKKPRPRKPSSMKVLEIDLTSEPSFREFASNYFPKSDAQRNPIILAWFKEHRPDEVVTANHVYTCYRTVKWPAEIEDFPSVLRSLKKQQLVKGVGKGQYEINHLGIARVEKIGLVT